MSCCTKLVTQILRVSRGCSPTYLARCNLLLFPSSPKGFFTNFPIQIPSSIYDIGGNIQRAFKIIYLKGLKIHPFRTLETSRDCLTLTTHTHKHFFFKLQGTQSQLSKERKEFNNEATASRDYKPTETMVLQDPETLAGSTLDEPGSLDGVL